MSFASSHTFPKERWKEAAYLQPSDDVVCDVSLCSCVHVVCFPCNQKCISFYVALRFDCVWLLWVDGGIDYGGHFDRCDVIMMLPWLPL